MIIQVDQEGANIISILIDASLKYQGIQMLDTANSVTRTIKLINPEETIPTKEPPIKIIEDNMENKVEITE